MEKSRHGAFVYAQKVLKHSLFLFLLINLLSISPDISASTTLLEQKYTLNLSFKDARLEQVLDAIMKQSGVKIAYSSDELQKDRVVSVDIQTSDILTAYALYWATVILLNKLRIISQSPGKRHPILRMSSITLLLMTGFGLSKDRFLKIQNRLIHYQE